MSSKVARNIVSGILGKTAASVATFVFLPLYRPLLGSEAFGLVGYSVAIGIAFTFLSGALEPVMVREVAIRQARRRPLWDLVRGNEYLHGLFALCLILGSGWIAMINMRSISLEELDPAVAIKAIQLVLIATALDFASKPYLAVMVGRQEHHLSATLVALRSWGEAAGGYVVLLLTGDLLAFFWCYLLVRLAVLPIAAGLAWYPMRKDMWGFRVGMKTFEGMKGLASLTLVAAACGAGYQLLEQKIIGITLGLGLLGIFNLAAIPAAAATNLAGNVRSAIMPRLCELEGEGAGDAALGPFLKGGELLALLATPILVCLAIFPHPWFMLWQRDASIMSDLAPLGALFSASTVFFGASLMVSQLEFTKGRIRFTLASKVCKLLVFVPLIYLGVRQGGLIGVGIAALAFSVSECLLLGFACFRSYTERGSFVQWIVRGLLFPLVLTAAIGITILWMEPFILDVLGPYPVTGRGSLLLPMIAPGMMLGLSTLALVGASPFLREAVAEQVAAFLRSRGRRLGRTAV